MPRKQKRRRRYSDQDRQEALAALAANGGNLDRTARQLGIPRATLQAWRDGARHPEAAESAAPKKAALADRLEELAHKLLDAACEPGRLAGASLQQVATSLGIALDKMRLLRGQPTQIGEQTGRLDFGRLSDEDLDTLERLGERVLGPAGPGGGAGGEGPSPPA